MITDPIGSALVFVALVVIAAGAPLGLWHHLHPRPHRPTWARGRLSARRYAHRPRRGARRATGNHSR